jgi:hypothetical protein
MNFILPKTRRWAPRIAGVFLALLAGPAFAQGTPPIVKTETGGLAVELSGHRLVFPEPVWTVVSSEAIDQAQVRYNSLAEGVDSLVLLPVGATVVTWTELEGILTVKRPGYTRKTQIASVVAPLTESCVADQLNAATFGTEEKGAILLLCGRYKPSAKDIPKRCGGGIILAAALESALGAAKVYHEWCTSSYDVDDETKWPVAQADLAQYAENLIAIASFEPLPATD